MKLGGWSRLAIALSVAWFLAVAVYLFVEYQRVPEQCCSDPSMYLVSCKVQIESPYSQPWDIAAEKVGISPWAKVALDPEFRQLVSKQKSEVRDAFWARVSEAVPNPTREKVKRDFFRAADSCTLSAIQASPRVAWLSGVLLVPILALWLAGITLGWIFRGFFNRSGNRA